MLLKARVVLQEKDAYNVLLNDGNIVRTCLSGRLRHKGLFPTVGDFVVLDENFSRIEDVTPRFSKLSRKGAGSHFEEQVLAANIHAVLLVTSFNKEMNFRRLERGLVMIQDCGIRPIIVLTKKDLMDDDERRLRVEKIKAITIDAYPIVEISCFCKSSIDELCLQLLPNETYAVIGSSGVGKSTLINLLLGDDMQPTQEIGSFRHQGLHTTTSRHLFSLKNGAFIIDTPGIREIQLMESSEGMSDVFSEIEALKKKCRFKNCSHQEDLDCAIQAALDSNQLDKDRLKNYLKLEKEKIFLRSKMDENFRREHFSERKNQWKKVIKEHRQRKKFVE